MHTLQNDYVGPVEELQRYLRVISRYTPEVPVVYPDGIYGPGTADAVRAFQRVYDLPVTGTVDNDTWNKIIEVYEEAENHLGPPLALPVFNSMKGVVRLGEENDAVYAIQMVLNTLNRRYSGYDPVAITGIYDQITADAVAQFQRRTNLPVTGETDKDTWNTMVRLYEHYRVPH